MNHIVVQQALQGQVASGTSLLPSEILKILSDGLKERAYISLIPTQRARPTERKVEDRGMVIETAIPVYGSDSEICGVVYGGILLNRKFDLVDRIRETVFDIDYWYCY